MNARDCMAVRSVCARTCLTAMLFLAFGCEEDRHRPLGHGHDFGYNNPDLCLAMGDSITSGEENPGPDYPSLLAARLGKRVVNLGRGGALSAEGRQIAGGALATWRPGFVLVLYGVNDIIHGRSLDEVAGNLGAMVRAIKNNGSIPVIATLTPVSGRYGVHEPAVRELNRRIRRLAREERILVADLESAFGADRRFMLADGLHPNTEGNERMAAVFHAKLR